MKITDVVLFRVSGRYTGPQFATGSRQAKALDIYPEFNIDGDTGISERPISALYVEIQTDEDVSGIFGPIEEPNAFTIRHALRPFLIGRDPLATELLSDQMLRLDRHGKSGYFVTGASAIDIALWDLKGKAWGQPVYRLLGGPTRPAVPAYASMLGFSTAPDDAAKLAAEYKAKGYAAQKWFFRYGPGDGAAGMAKNLAMAEAVRGAVGSLYDVMFDAFWGWDLAYATKMVQELAHLTPRWMEEPIPPERVGGFVQLRAASTVPIATGEHVYTRWQVKELLANAAVDVLQNDPDWTGGISEQMKVCTLGSAYEVPVIAHGHSLLPALHVAGAQSPATVPYVEFLLRYQEVKQFFQTVVYRPENGAIALPDLPGLGMVLDESKIEKREVLS
ncbi:MAG: enolase C-terminal domain-like protein [Caldilineaceae bacterium]